MDAFAAGARTRLIANVPSLEIDVTFYGSPLVADDMRIGTVSVTLTSGESIAALGARINTAVLAEAARQQLAVPANIYVPTYTKLK